MVLILAAAIVLPAQDPIPQIQPLSGADAQQNPAQQPSPPVPTPASLHGVVLNAATDDPLPRALVSIQGDAATGALTDGDGKFDLPNLPVGPVVVTVQKPGYFDGAEMKGSGEFDSVPAAAHNVMVAEDMPDVEFRLVPDGAIRGQIDLSSGDPADGITVNLMKRTVMDGRAGWVLAGNTKTHSDGTYRFGGLAPGTYELSTLPSLDSEGINSLVQPSRSAPAREWGYAAVYYPDAREQSGASNITVQAGETAQANMTLKREAFQAVTATAVLSEPTGGRGFSYSPQVMDSSGSPLPYPARYDDNAKTIQAQLPDGSYRLMIIASPQPRFSLVDGGRPATISNPSPFQGSVNVEVAGQPVNNLRLPMIESHPAEVQINVLHSGPGTQPSQGGEIVVTVTPASSSPGQIPGGGLVTMLASGELPGPLEGQSIPPGAYWVHVAGIPPGLCESSFTAGGANLAREPLLIGMAGIQTPLELTLRDDCAKLTLSLPESLTGNAPGEEKFYTMYAVPDSDYTGNLQQATLRPSSGGSATMQGLTPGKYHVYTFAGNAQLEYHDPAVLAAAQGQEVTLSPGAETDLVVETEGTGNRQ